MAEPARDVVMHGPRTVTVTGTSQVQVRTWCTLQVQVGHKIPTCSTHTLQCNHWHSCDQECDGMGEA
jgi:hypothetical protein